MKIPEIAKTKKLLERRIIEQRYAMVCEHVRKLERELAEANEWAKCYEYLRTERKSYLDGKPFIGVNNGCGFSVWTDEHADMIVKAAMKEKP